jgi:hypothetical protein
MRTVVHHYLTRSACMSACRRRTGMAAAAAGLTVLWAAQAWAQGAPPEGARRPDAPNPAIDAILAAALPPLPPDAPQPSPEPRSFEGTWYHHHPLIFQLSTDMYGSKTPLNEAAKKILARRIASLHQGTPFVNASAICKPTGQPLQFEINSPMQIYQAQDWIQFLFFQYHGEMTVLLDLAKAPAETARPYMGRSVGHWDGDTLVVETTGFRQAIWLDVNGTPASADAKLTQRIRKVMQGDWQLEIVTTVDDPTYYTRPWSWIRAYAWRPDKQVFGEFDCESQVGRKDYLSVSGLVPEPND